MVAVTRRPSDRLNVAGEPQDPLGASDRGTINDNLTPSNRNRCSTWRRTLERAATVGLPMRVESVGALFVYAR